MDNVPNFTFTVLKEPIIGSGYSKFCSYQIRMQGRDIIKEAVQAHVDELASDPWEQSQWTDE